ncbi:Transcriptional regulator, AraC family [Leucobacter sp. 7(1)]|nr:Transcriptional regulator, AraC family [Leucobacter sp. 7(1)]
MAQLLESVDLTVTHTRRVSLAPRERWSAPVGVTSLLYLDAGELRGVPVAACATGPRRCEITTSEVADPAQAGLSAGSALLALGRTPHTFTAAEPTTLIVVTLELTETAQRLHALLPDPLTMVGFSAHDPAVAALASNMGHPEPDSADDANLGTPLRPGDAVICQLMARTLLLSVLRAWYSAGCAPADWSARVADPHLDRVLQAIHENPGHDWSLDGLATLGTMSRSVFARRFREVLGASPWQYLASLRMEDAKRRLATGASVTQTSRELGYASDEGFSRAFRRHTGVPPSRWRSREEPVGAR